MVRDDRHNCADPRRRDSYAQRNHFGSYLAAQRPTSQISLCRSGTPPEESIPMPKCGPHASEVCLAGFPTCSLHVTLSGPKPEILLLTSQFRRQRFSEFLTAGLSRRRSRVRTPSSPPFLFNVFPIFSNSCCDLPR